MLVTIFNFRIYITQVNKILLKFSNAKSINLDRGYEGPVDFSLSGLSEGKYFVCFYIVVN